MVVLFFSLLYDILVLRCLPVDGLPCVLLVGWFSCGVLWLLGNGGVLLLSRGFFVKGFGCLFDVGVTWGLRAGWFWI